MIELNVDKLYQWDQGVEVSGFTGNAVQFANQGDSQAVTILLEDKSSARIPDRYLISGNPVKVYDVTVSEKSDVTETHSVTIFPVTAKPKPRNYVPTEAEKAFNRVLNLAQDAADSAKEASNEASNAKESANRASTAAANAETTASDLKVGYNGKTYDTAGEAVRGQIGAIESAFDIKEQTGNNILNPLNEVPDSGFPDAPTVGEKLTATMKTNRETTRDAIELPLSDTLYLLTDLEGFTGTISGNGPGVFLYFLDENEGFLSRVGRYFKNLIGASEPTSVSVPTGAKYVHIMITGNANGCYLKNVCISAVKITGFEEYSYTEIRKLADAASPAGLLLSVENIRKTYEINTGENILDPKNSETGEYSTTAGEDGKIKPVANTGRTRTIEPIPIKQFGGTITLYAKSQVNGSESSTASVRAFWLDKDLKLIGTSSVRFSSMKDGKTATLVSPSKKAVYFHVEVGSKSTGHDFTTECFSWHELAEFKSYEERLQLTQAAKPTPIAPTNGMKMLVFGDSITETADITVKTVNGITVVDTFNPNYRYNWPSFTAHYLQVEMMNYAKAGATLRDTGYVDGIPKDDVEYRMNISEQISLALQDKEFIPDIIVISAGTNDSLGMVQGTSVWRDTYEEAMSMPLLSDFTYETRGTLHKALRSHLWTLKNAYPKAKCFIATPIQRETHEIPQELLDAIRVMGNRYCFEVIDAYSESGIIRENEMTDGVFLYDGLHPNEDGAERMARLFSSKILEAFAYKNYNEEGNGNA